MIIRSLFGTTIYESNYRTLKAALEDGVTKGVDFSCVDLRSANLRGASLDGMRARGADLWGADLTDADIGLSDLRKADLRMAILKDTCLAESDLTEASLHGAYFSGTIFEGAVLDRMSVSCPSFWDIDVSAARSAFNLVYSHKGEENLVVGPDVLVARLLGEKLVMNGGHCLWRGEVYKAGDGNFPLPLAAFLQSLADKAQDFLKSSVSHNAKEPIRKSGNQESRV